jgi:putative acetyltransferase
MIVEPETPALVSAIRAAHLAAFPTAAEADLVERLRRDGDAAIALVARADTDLVGHIILSPMAAPLRALGLGPVAVAPEHQGRGVGSALIGAALASARTSGWEAVFVLGDPAYYTRFGFSVSAAEGFTSPYAGPYFMVLALDNGGLPVRTGRVDYAPAFRVFE